MNRPTTLDIMGIPYKVEIVEGFLEEWDKEVKIGEHDMFTQTLRVTDRLAKEVQNKTIIHEALHAMLLEAGLEKYNKESFVEPFTGVLYSFLKANDMSFLRGKSKQPELSAQLAVKVEPTSWVERARQISDSVQTSVEKKGKAQELKDAIQDLPLTVSRNTETVQERPKQLPLTGGSNKGFPLADVVKFKKTEKQEQTEDPSTPKHWETGIQIKEGVECYKTRYYCHACGHQGHRYVAKEAPVRCHECETELEKAPATSKGFPHQDARKNFFYTAGVHRNE